MKLNYSPIHKRAEKNYGNFTIMDFLLAKLKYCHSRDASGASSTGNPLIMKHFYCKNVLISENHLRKVLVRMDF